MMNPPRVAFLADSFHDVNGAALTCRQLDAFARRRDLPFLSVHAGDSNSYTAPDPHGTLELKRGPLAVKLDRDLSFDPLLFFRRNEVMKALRAFRPDVIHIASPGDFGVIGWWAATVLRVPLVASWHTNLHSFAARRIEHTLDFLSLNTRQQIAGVSESWIRGRELWFYDQAAVTLAPNRELIRLIGDRTHKPVLPMERGIDMAKYSPAHRTNENAPFTIGFVGRLTPEKNVRFLAQLEKELVAANAGPFRILVVGDGTERPWLEANLRHGEFTGVLTGHELSEAYANMDAFVFPSHTDTFGNVVLEAMSSGVPAIVTSTGGPKYLVAHGESGFITNDAAEMIASVRLLISDDGLLRRMRKAAREHVKQFSWDYVCEKQVYAAYARSLNRATVTNGACNRTLIAS